MPKTKKYSFSDKKIILQSLNNGLINGYLKKEFIYKFDKIFNNISIDEFDLHIFLFKLWNQEKNLIKQYVDNDNKLKQILEYINKQLNTIELVNNIDKEEEKIKILYKIEDNEE